VLALSKPFCFSCHASETKVSGPSFEQVAVRYKNASDPVNSVTKKIIDGSTGTILKNSDRKSAR
jgi:cytochrome c551/c552